MSQCLHFTSIQLAELFSDSTSILEQTRHKADRNIRNKSIYKTKTYLEWNGQIRELISIRNTSHKHNSKDPSPLVLLLCSLHWLPVDSWIQYKLASLCCNGLNSYALGYLTQLKIYKPYPQATYALLLILLFSCLSPLSAHLPVWSDVLLMLHHLCGMVSLSQLSDQTHSNPSNHVWHLQALLLTVSVCVYPVCSI